MARCVRCYWDALGSVQNSLHEWLPNATLGATRRLLNLMDFGPEFWRFRSHLAGRWFNCQTLVAVVAHRVRMPNAMCIGGRSNEYLVDVARVAANLTRRGTSLDQFCVRFPYTLFSRRGAFLTQLSTAETDRNKQTEADGNSGKRRSATDRDMQRRIDKHTYMQTNFEELGRRHAHSSTSQPACYPTS